MSICDVPVIAEVCNVGGEAAGALVAAPFDWLAQAVGHAAAWMFESVWAIFDTTTLVDVTSEQYVAVYNVVFGVAIFLMLIFFFLQLTTGLIRRDPGALQRAVLGLGKSVLGSFVVITLTAMLLEIVDQLCVGIVHATGTTMEEMGDRIAAMALGLTAISIATPGVGAIITIVLGGLAVAGAAIVWGTLLIRKALLLVAIVVAPLALSGASWDATRGWISRWASFVIALIVSKLVIVLVFLVAAAQVSSPLDFDLASIADPIAGIVLMFIAAFAPYMTYRFISFMGIDLHHAVSAEQESKAAVARPSPIAPQQLGGVAKVVGVGAAGSGSVSASGRTPAPAGTAVRTAGAAISSSGSAAAAVAAGGSAAIGGAAGGRVNRTGSAQSDGEGGGGASTSSDGGPSASAGKTAPGTSPQRGDATPQAEVPATGTPGDQGDGTTEDDPGPPTPTVAAQPPARRADAPAPSQPPTAVPPTPSSTGPEPSGPALPQPTSREDQGGGGDR